LLFGGLLTVADLGGRILRLIDRLVQYTVRTGVLTSVGAVAVMVAYLVLPNTRTLLPIFSLIVGPFSD